MLSAATTRSNRLLTFVALDHGSGQIIVRFGEHRKSITHNQRESAANGLWLKAKGQRPRAKSQNADFATIAHLLFIIAHGGRGIPSYV
jgi:hypothetical protein